MSARQSAPGYDGNNVDPTSKALASALTRARVETAARSDAESELARVRRELGAALNTITGLKDELAGLLRKYDDDTDALVRSRVPKGPHERQVAELHAVIAEAPHWEWCHSRYAVGFPSRKTQRFTIGPNCLNCGELGAHFIPPSFGDAGFFMCTKKVEGS